MALPLFLPCAAGVEDLLADEVAGILARALSIEPRVAGLERRRGGVALTGDPAEVMALNLHSRLAQRVLVQVADGPYVDEHGLYHLARRVDWGLWLTPRQTLRVDVTTQHSPVRSLRYAALRIKDAVCDRQREDFGERPSVDTRDPDLPLVLHLEPEHARLYVDTSGAALFKRGWRDDVGDAPLKETLAAALLAAAGWRGRPDAGGALHDPCCGSGTIAIEAAQIACGIAPGLTRRFAFERQRPFQSPEHRATWRRLVDQARDRIHPPAVPVSASDVSFRMVDFARRNAERAGVAHAITFHGGDALQRPPPPVPLGMPGTVMLNPPYGERIVAGGTRGRAAPDAPPRDERDAGPRAVHRGQGREAAWTLGLQEPPLSVGAAPPADAADERRRVEARDFAARLATHWKRAWVGGPTAWTAWVLSPDRDLPSAMRLKATRRVPLWNGAIECRLFRFDLVAGSMRERSGNSRATDAAADGAAGRRMAADEPDRSDSGSLPRADPD
jgi:putative N6-adenine-specific DNA methylase